MIKHGFSYSDLRKMSLREIRFWAEGLKEFLDDLFGGEA